MIARLKSALRRREVVVRATPCAGRCTAIDVFERTAISLSTSSKVRLLRLR